MSDIVLSGEDRHTAVFVSVGAKHYNASIDAEYMVHFRKQNEVPDRYTTENTRVGWLPRAAFGVAHVLLQAVLPALNAACKLLVVPVSA